jgi:hypothetical protein
MKNEAGFAAVSQGGAWSLDSFPPLSSAGNKRLRVVLPPWLLDRIEAVSPAEIAR